MMNYFLDFILQCKILQTKINIYKKWGNLNMYLYFKIIYNML